MTMVSNFEAARAQPAIPAARAWLWALGSAAAFVAVGVATLLGVATVERLAFEHVAEAGTVGHSVALGIWPLLWGLGSIIAAAGFGRIAFDRWLPVSGFSILLPAVGVALAAATSFELAEWARLRFAYYDPEHVGWTAGLPVVVVSVAVSLFGVLVAPRGAAAPPLTALASAVAMTLVVVGPNVPGLAEGIEPGEHRAGTGHRSVRGLRRRRGPHWHEEGAVAAAGLRP